MNYQFQQQLGVGVEEDDPFADCEQDKVLIDDELVYE